MTVLLAESREESSRDGTTYGSLIDGECQKMEKTVLSTYRDGAVLLREVLCIMSVSPWIVDGHIR